MTESEWNASAEPASMLAFLLGQRESGVVGSPFLERVPVVSDRKLLLFCCTCCRLNACRPEDVDEYEKGDSEIPISDPAQWATVWCRDDGYLVSRAVKADLLRHLFTPFTPVLSRPCGKCRAAKELVTAVRKIGITLGAENDRSSALCECKGKGHLPISPPTEKCGNCDQGWLPKSGTPDPGMVSRCPKCKNGRVPSFPTLIVQLAEAVYDGNDATFALHDALLDNGEPWAVKVAEHFGQSAGCMKGCAHLDVILGKE